MARSTPCRATWTCASSTIAQTLWSALPPHGMSLLRRRVRSMPRPTVTASSFPVWTLASSAPSTNCANRPARLSSRPTLYRTLRMKAGAGHSRSCRDCWRDGLVPPQITQWHYDRVHDCFRNRGAAFVGDWPGYYGDYVADDSPVRDDFALALYPVGPTGESHVYGGSHTFALTHAGAGQARGAGAAPLPDGARAADARGAARLRTSARVRHGRPSAPSPSPLRPSACICLRRPSTQWSSPPSWRATPKLKRFSGAQCRLPWWAKLRLTPHWRA